MRTAHLEAQIDTARNRLDAVAKAQADTQDEIDKVVVALALIAGAGASDLRCAMESIADSLWDLTRDARSDLEREISNAEQELSDIEYRDVRRSAPVVL